MNSWARPIGTALRGIAMMGIIALTMTAPAQAGTIKLDVAGPGVSAALTLNYGPATDATYAQAFKITGVSGTFTDTNNGLNIIDASIASLVAVNHATPEATNLLAPDEFSRFAVATGLSPISNGFLTYDNLFWPGGSPQTASDYPVSGGFFDIYGLMFTLAGGQVVDLWSNGVFGGPDADYGVAVATSQTALDYVGGGVSVTATPVPEPVTMSLFTAGLAGVVTLRRRKKKVA